MADITYPGVYIEEDASLSLSITAGATAVPIFASGPIASEEDDWTWPARVNSWLDFTKFRQGKDGDKPAFDPERKLDITLKSYFENGGGYCYLAPNEELVNVVPRLDDVTLIVSAGEDINSAVSTLCIPGGRLFAILDGEDKELAATFDQTVFKSYAPTNHAAVYFPWLKADWAKTKVLDGNGSPTGELTPTSIPPSGAVAGAICRVDRERGVWKAPANVPLNGGLKVKSKVSDDIQGTYTNNNSMALNIIREFSGVGTVIWGARTLAIAEGDKWRYIPVRRLFDTAERDIKKAMQFALFEPNSQPTWERVRAAIDNYLHALWQQGALMGSTPKEAYFVQIGQGLTMDETDINQGRMIVKIGMAAVRPAEFIILQFTQEVGQV